MPISSFHERDARPAGTAKACEHAGFAKAQAETLAVTIAGTVDEARRDLVTEESLRGELKVEIAGVES